jgi:hypothetical protein
MVGAPGIAFASVRASASAEASRSTTVAPPVPDLPPLPLPPVPRPPLPLPPLPPLARPPLALPPLPPRATEVLPPTAGPVDEPPWPVIAPVPAEVEPPLAVWPPPPLPVVTPTAPPHAPRRSAAAVFFFRGWILQRGPHSAGRKEQSKDDRGPLANACACLKAIVLPWHHGVTTLLCRIIVTSRPARVNSFATPES